MEFDEPSYEDLKEQLAALELVVDQQAAENAKVRALLAARDARVAELEARLADLEERLGRNPRNSSMPPSAEGPSKPPANRQQRRSEARRQGKQPGAEGKHLAQVADPDEVLLHTPPACPDCGAGLEGAEVVGDEVRQVFDLPRMGPHVTEHHLLRLRCRCGCEVKAEAPADATAPACYGYGVRALACYLAVHQHLPYERMSQLFSDVLGIEVSVGALATMVGEAGGMLGGFSETVRDLLRDAPAVNFDETGGRVAGSLHWVHVACSSLYTLIECHKKRGRVAMGEMGVIEKMRGVAVHDGWKPYRSYDVSHQLCNAHHLRELEGVGVVFDQGWAKEMIELLIEAKEVVEAAKAAGRERLEPSALHSIRVRYGMLVAKGWAANPAPATGKRHGVQRKAANLLVRLDGQRDDVLRFATDFRASWDNNQAERDVRMVKLQQKISGSWRTLAGARAYCSIRSYISTMRKHDADVLDGLRRMFEGQAWLPART